MFLITCITSVPNQYYNHSEVQCTIYYFKFQIENSGTKCGGVAKSVKKLILSDNHLTEIPSWLDLALPNLEVLLMET